MVVGAKVCDLTDSFFLAFLSADFWFRSIFIRMALSSRSLASLLSELLPVLAGSVGSIGAAYCLCLFLA